MRGRRPKPTALKLIEGNRGKTKLNEDEPKPTMSAKTPRPLSRLSTRSRRIWRREARELHQLGTLTNADLGAFAILCDVWGEYDDANEQLQKLADENGGTTPFATKGARGHSTRNTLQRQREYLRKELRGMMVEFGMTPSSRSRVATKADEDEADYDPFAGLY